MNKLILKGRLTKDLILRKTQTEKNYTFICLAIDKYSKEGNTTDFIDLIAWNKTADYLVQYARKGTLVIIDGYASSRLTKDNKKELLLTVNTVEILAQPKITSSVEKQTVNTVEILAQPKITSSVEKQTIKESTNTNKLKSNDEPIIWD